MSGRDERPVVWLLSAYQAASHAAWVAWLRGCMPRVNWRVCELTGRHFRWRIRGNPLSWMGRLPADTPDRILATSMVDLATLRGLNPRIAHVPACYYFHENQFAYPAARRRNFDAEALFWMDGALYLFTKHRSDTETTLYRLPVSEPSEERALDPIADFELPPRGHMYETTGADLQRAQGGLLQGHEHRVVVASAIDSARAQTDDQPADAV